MWTFYITLFCFSLHVRATEEGLAYLPGNHNSQYSAKFQRAFESIGSALGNQGSKDVNLKFNGQSYPKSESEQNVDHPIEQNEKTYDSEGPVEAKQENDGRLREQFWSQLFLKHDLQQKKSGPEGERKPEGFTYEMQSKIFDKFNEKENNPNSGVRQVMENQELDKTPIEIPVETTPTALFVIKAPSLMNGDKEWSVSQHNERQQYPHIFEDNQDYDREVDIGNGKDSGSDQSLITHYYPQPPFLAKPKINSVEAKCSKEAMNVRVTYDKPFDGIIYAKDYYNDPSCHFVEHRSGQLIFEFTLHMNRCGTSLIDEYDSKGETVLENTLIFQNEITFQEIWDSVRRLKCTWSGIFDKTVQTSINVGILDSQTITYRGDSVESVMDVQYGHGLEAGPVQGLVRIGDDLTLSVSLIGADANNFDVRVKDCIAHNGDVRNSVQLTDESGCVLKKKLLGQWQKQRNVKDASVTTFSYIQAFRFPEKMEVYFECNIEICRFECRAFCPDNEEVMIRSQSNRKEEDIKLRAKRTISRFGNKTNENRVEPIRLLRGIRVVVPNDIDFIEPRNLSSISKDELMLEKNNSVCVPISNFVITLFIVFIILMVLSLLSVIQCLKYFDKKHINRKMSYIQR